MKWYAGLLLLLLFKNLDATVLYAQTINSTGSLNFKCNGQLYAADSSHARAYGLKQTDAAFIKAANTDNIVLSVEWKGLKGPGVYIITSKESKAEFTIDHKTYLLNQAGDYIKIVIASVKQAGSFLLLSGTFEGQLQDKNGNKIKISEGKFNTFSL
jgi:hypothetical protein